MTAAYPDLEIYVKRAGLEEIERWLQARLGVKETRRRGDAVVLRLTGSDTECVVVENAVKGGFTSLWFRQGEMPWPTDRDCAIEAFAALGKEVRCTTGSWTPDETSDEWIRINEAGESRVKWQT